MSKQYIIVVAGYIRHSMLNEIEDAFSERVGYSLDEDEIGIHIYPYNSEGYQTFVVSNRAIPTHEVNLGTLECETAEVDDQKGNEGIKNAGVVIYDEPVPVTVDDHEFLYLGGMHGYDYDSTSPDDDRYEC